MPRTADEIAFTDKLAADIGYIEPPIQLAPRGNIYEDNSWADLVDWFREQDIDWAKAIEVFISRRRDVSIQQVYVGIDSWKKRMFARIEREEDPDAVVSFN